MPPPPLSPGLPSGPPLPLSGPPLRPRVLPCRPQNLPCGPRDLPFGRPSGLGCGPRDLPCRPRDLPCHPRDLPCRTPGLRPLGRAPHCGRQASFSSCGSGLSICSALAPERTGSGVGALGLSCTWPPGALVPLPGIEPESPALRGGFLPTGPAEKSHLPLNSSDGKHEQPCRCMTLELLQNLGTDFSS